MSNRIQTAVCFAVGVCWCPVRTASARARDKAPNWRRASFVRRSARPWVYWFWLNGNITRAGITADLEAMKRVGSAAC